MSGMTFPEAPIRILLVDDHAVVREGVRMLIEGQDDLELVGEAWDRAGTAAAIARERPDLVLLDLDLGGENGLDLLREIGALSPETRILVFTGVRDRDVHQRAVQLGAQGIVSKEKAASVLLTAIRKVHSGEAWIDRTMVSSLLRDARQSRERSDPEAARIRSLTPRESEIVRLVAQGNGTRRLAEQLGVSEKTVRNHLVSIYDKLDVSDRLELAIYAVRHGLAPQPR
jgi:two-component system, NarL family, nitrate/nitrite response regulator NarL